MSEHYYWSRLPGKFVNKLTGEPVSLPSGLVFTGTVREWYETLVETLIDCANAMHRMNSERPTNIVVSQTLAFVIQSSVLYSPNTDPSKTHFGQLVSMYMYIDANVPNDEIHVRYTLDQKQKGVITVLDLSVI